MNNKIKLIFVVICLLLPFNNAFATENELKDLTTNELSDLTKLEILINKCADMAKTLEKELATVKEAVAFIKHKEGQTLEIADRMETLESKYKDKIRTIEIVNNLKEEEMKTFVNKTVESLNLREKDMDEVQERLDSLEGKFEDERELIDEVKVANVSEELDSMKNAIKSIKEREEDILDLSSRLKTLENKWANSFDTVDTLKEATAELRKGLEDQEITTSIIQKELKRDPAPKTEGEKSVEEQLSVISELVLEHDKELTDVIGAFENENIDPKNDEIKDAPTMDERIVEAGNDLNKAEAQVEAEPEQEGDIFNLFKDKGYFEIGNGFYAKDISFQPFGSSVELSGIILNASAEDYNIANFKILVYDDNSEFLREQEFSLKGIAGSESKSFYEIISGVKTDKIANYAIVFGNNKTPDQLQSVKPAAKPEFEALLDQIKELDSEPSNNETRAESLKSPDILP